jgi:glycosyltransferase involved in cell wall biosynthesis
MLAPPLRVLFFTPTLGAGGAEMQLLRLLGSFDRSEVAPVLCVARAGGSYERRLPPDVPLHVCTQNVRSSLVSAARSLRPLRRRMRELQPQVAVSLLEHTSLALSGSLLGLRPRPKLVLGIQNNFSLGMQKAPLHVRRLLAPLYLRAYARADHVVALSRGVADDLQRQLPAVAAKTSVVYNAGMDHELEQRALEPLLEPRPSAPLIVACGRLVEQKDFATLLEALARLETRPSPELWLLGEGPLEAALRARARQLRIAERVRFRGFRDNPYPFMAAADVLALSSRWEGFANVIVEALACGTPVVATDCPYGPAEILDHGRHGALVPVGDAGALARALAVALRAGKTPERSAACRARARMFDAAASARGYVEVFRRVTSAAS